VSTLPAVAEPPSNFSAAKRVAVELWQEIGAASFYCQCPYRPATAEEKILRRGNLWVVGSVCGYQARDLISSKGRPIAATTRIEWEHVVPADWIATGFGCQEETRSECREIEGYEEAEGDFFNLVPAIGELNQDRSARLFGEIEGERREYGSCDFEVTTDGPGEPHVRGSAEPMDSIRGDIARIWLYMIDRYSLNVGDEYRSMLNRWDERDPVDEAERVRHEVIRGKMGHRNPFVVD